jgi:hypothetical protein
MKWFLIITLCFSIGWIVYKNDLPDAIKNSGFADFTNSALYPIEYELQKVFPKLIKNSKNIKLLESDPQTVTDMLAKLQISSLNSYVFIYDDNSIMVRHILSGVNRILQKNPYLVDRFIILAVGSDSKKFKVFLGSFRRVYFKPYYLDEKHLPEIKTYFSLKNNGESISHLPISFYKKKSTMEFDDISSGFLTKGRLEQLLENNL